MDSGQHRVSPAWPGSRCAFGGDCRWTGQVRGVLGLGADCLWASLLGEGRDKRTLTVDLLPEVGVGFQ
jgi:hypothetical protein